jgi:transcriptional regulator with XRE-family HTH domain
MGVKSTFGENLRFYRREKRLSQEQLSEQVNISVKHLSAIERGLTFVSAELLEKLSASLDTPVFCFFVKGKGVFYNDRMLHTLDSLIETHIKKAVEDITADIRQHNEEFPRFE